MSKFHAIYGKGGDTPTPTPTPTPTNKLVFLGATNNNINIKDKATSAGLDSSTLKKENFLFVPMNWIVNASGGSKVNEKKSESGSSNGTYSFSYDSDTAILTISSQPSIDLQGEQAYTSANAIITFNIYYYTGDVINE